MVLAFQSCLEVDMVACHVLLSCFVKAKNYTKHELQMTSNRKKSFT
jgi:hypothetical protein